jgi:CheY-like chemotaxis protein
MCSWRQGLLDKKHSDFSLKNQTFVKVMEAFNIFDVWGKVFYGGDILEHPFKELLFFYGPGKKGGFFHAGIKEILQHSGSCDPLRCESDNFVELGEVRPCESPCDTGGHHRLTPETVAHLLSGEDRPEKRAQVCRKVLLVDDDEGMIRFLHTRFFRLGIHVESASNGFEAGVKVKECMPDLVILDLFMDGMDGFEVCRFLKRKKDLSALKIIAMTGFDAPEVKERILGAGADAYVSKSEDMRVLMEKALELLGASEKIMSMTS